MRAFVLVALLLVASLSGCTDKLSLNSSGATLESPGFKVSPESGGKDTVFTVDAGKLGGKYALTWDFGDGTQATGGKAEHKYNFTNGVMTITLIVTDDAGKQGIATRTVKLGTGENADPTVSVRATKSWVEVRKPANLTATGRDSDKDPLTYLWTYRVLEGGAGGDGHAHSHEGSTAPAAAGQEFVIDATESKASVIFEVPGKYVVKVRASDPKGGEAFAETTIDVSRQIPSSVLQTTWNGVLTAGTGGNALGSNLWDTGAPDTNFDVARHPYTLLYPASTLIILQWNDTSTQGAFDLDLELRDAKTGEVVFSSATRAPAVPFEFNMTEQQPGDYVIWVKAVAGAQVEYSVLLSATLRITPALVAAAEGN